MKDFTHKGYLELLARLKQQGKAISSFRDLDNTKDAYVILRHDIDFSLPKALEMAQLDSEAGVTSTFFFLLTAPYYNALCEGGVELIQQIAALGHEIGLHYDCTGFELLTEAQRQKRIQLMAATLEDATGAPVRSIAQHKPAKSAIRQEFPDFINAYDAPYLSDIAYVSDSRGMFRHDDLQAFFEQNKKVQLLIHPIWWNKTLIPRAEIFAALGNDVANGINGQLAEEERSIADFFANRKQ
ncbi:MAG: hypothetical protein V4649_03785 [Bacteroidota bacterium]